MNFRPQRGEDVELNITPLIDVVFLLLIFFMVSTTFKQDFEIGLDLPEATSEKRLEEKTLELTIDAEGKYYVNGRQVVNTQTPTLRRALQKAAAGKTDIPLIISADGKTPHQAVVTAMDAARQIGLTHLTFATKQPSTK